MYRGVKGRCRLGFFFFCSDDEGEGRGVVVVVAIEFDVWESGEGGVVGLGDEGFGALVPAGDLDADEE